MSQRRTAAPIANNLMFAPISDESRYGAAAQIVDALDVQGLLQPLTPTVRFELVVGTRDIRSVLR